MTGRSLILSAAVLSLLQIGFLSWIVAGRAAVLRDGREITLKVKPVDPRDLLRGDYVRLGYDISEIPLALFANLPESKSVDTGQAVYLMLRRGADGFWAPVSASLDTPPEAPASPDEAIIRGEVPYWRNLESYSTVEAEYGIERFYLPEGQGLAIERDMAVRSFSVKVALDGSGTPQIKAFMDGETMLYEEPLY